MSIAIPARRCSVLYQGKKERQKAIVAAMCVFDPSGEAGVVLRGLGLRLGEGVVFTDLGAAGRSSHPKVGEELRGAPAVGAPTVRMQSQRVGFDAILQTGLLDELGGQRGSIALDDHLSDHVSAEDVEQHVQVEVRPGFRPHKARVGSSRSALSSFERWVSPARPPNRTCDSHRIRISMCSCRRIRRPGSAVARWCSFVRTASTRDSASTGPGHEAPVFTSGLPAVQ